MKNRKLDIHPYTKQFYKGNIIYFIFALCETLLGAIGALLVSWLIQQLIDLIGGYETGFNLLQLTIITLVLIGGIAVANMISYHSKPKFITRGISQYKEYVFSELTKKNISAFSGENSSTYISALTNDIQTIEQGYLWNTFSMLESLLTFIGAMALMIWYSPLLTLIAIGLSLLPLIASILTGNKVAVEEKKVSDRNEAYTSTLRDSLGGFSVIKSFKAEAQMIRIFKENVRELAKAQCGKHKMRILVQMFGSVAGITAQLGVFIFGAYLALSGKGVTAGTTMIFVQLMNYVLSPIGTIPTCIAERKAAKALVEKIANALNANVREESKSEHKELKHSIVVKDLSFGYEPEKQVLKNVNCTFDLGKKYAIVGASGSGKSTLLNLLLASYQNYDGTILYDDTELRKISSSNLYEIESIIQQNVFVFNATIKDNITMFRDFSEEQIDEAIRLSGLSALIEEKGTDYLCGENGSGLSGGEKQRISIARSLLKKSQVLLVDEATAALDAETAYQVSSAILGLKDVTSIVVTHSLDEGLLKQYDGIITLKNGSIVEAGTATLTFTANSGYVLPDSVTVKDANSTWDKASGTLTLSIPTGNVSVSVVAEKNVVNLLDMSKRTYVAYSQENGDPQRVPTTDPHEMDYTKAYASDATARRGWYATARTVYTHNAAENGFTYQVTSNSGYGVEFPVDVVGGKSYVLSFKEAGMSTSVALHRYDSNTHFVDMSNVKTGGGSLSGTISRELTITPQTGYLYSVFFRDSVANTDHIITDISRFVNTFIKKISRPTIKAERDFHIGRLRLLLRDSLDDQQGTDHQQNGDGQADEPVLDKACDDKADKGDYPYIFRSTDSSTYL